MIATKIKVLFFSRGRGRGHAIPDIAIAHSFARMCPEIFLQFVSYGTGAETFRDFHYPVVDLGLPDANPFFETQVQVMKALLTEQPSVVVSHEELTPLPLARSLNVPSMFITDFFYPPNSFLNEPLAFAEHVVFLQNAGLFAEPEVVKGKVDYLGPLVRTMSYRAADRARARDELAIPPDTFVLSMMPGAWATETRAPLCDILLAAFDSLPVDPTLLLWIAGDDYEKLNNQLSTRRNVILHRSYFPLEQIMVASDVILTKSNRVTVVEAGCLGIPIISIAYGHNPVDELIVRTVRSNRVLAYGGMTVELLRQHIMRCRDERSYTIPGDWTTSDKVSEVLKDRISLLVHARNEVSLGSAA
jgi:UDP:flavonoid glycosyltransferase YjiC (YdhE family)